MEVVVIHSTRERIVDVLAVAQHVIDQEHRHW